MGQDELALPQPEPGHSKPKTSLVARRGIALCEGCGATTPLIEIDAAWAIPPAEFQAFLLRHQPCRARLGNRPWITLDILDALLDGAS